MPEPVPEFDQYTEYVTEGPVIHTIDLSQHSLEVIETVEAVAIGYIRAKTLSRALCADPELAMVFCEWTPADGMVTLAGVVAKKVLKGWTAKSVAAAYIVAPSAAIDAINAGRTTAVAFVRVSLNGAGAPLSPRSSFTAGQVSVLSTWINNHGITNAEFAALFGVSAAQLSNWLQNHPRYEFVQVLNERFS